MIQRKQFDNLENALLRHFDVHFIAAGKKCYTNYADGNTLTVTIHESPVMETYLRVAHTTFPEEGVTVCKEVSKFFDDDWTAERWMSFEALCKENL